jgi:hypothetical protein
MDLINLFGELRNRLWDWMQVRGINVGVASELMQAAGILMFVVVIIWYIFPFLPDGPPKKKNQKR